MEITVQSVEAKKGKTSGKTFYVVTTTDGQKMSSFDSKITEVTSGTVIDAEIDTKGEFTNLRSWRIQGQTAAETKPEPLSGHGVSSKQSDKVDTYNPLEELRLRSMSVAYAKDLCCAGKIGLEMMDAWAERFITVIKRLPVGPLPSAFSPLLDSDKTQADKDFDKLESAGTKPVEIDLAWLQESLETIGWADVGGWITKQYGVKGFKRISEGVVMMTPAQKQHFAAEVQKRLKEAGK